MKSVIVTPQLPIAYNTGGIGTFTWHLVQFLHSQGERIEIIYTRRPQVPREEWEPFFARMGATITCIEDSEDILEIPEGYDRHQYVSERVSQLIPGDADIVYFADWEANGFHYTQSRRYRTDRLPAVVTILHGNSKWSREGMQQWPVSYQELSLEYRERYTVAHSDYVVSPSRHMIEWMNKNGWQLPPSERVLVLGFPYSHDLDLARAHQDTSQAEIATQPFQRIVFYGRLDTRKGIDLFVNSLLGLASRPCMSTITEIVLLGDPARMRMGNQLMSRGF